MKLATYRSKPPHWRALDRIGRRRERERFSLPTVGARVIYRGAGYPGCAGFAARVISSDAALIPWIVARVTSPAVSAGILLSGRPSEWEF